MIEKLREIEQELMDELSPESYEQVKSLLVRFTPHETAVYKAGYLDGLQMVQAIGAIEIEKNRLFVAFNCKPETII